MACWPASFTGDLDDPSDKDIETQTGVVDDPDRELASNQAEAWTIAGWF
jgi:hypothetical protein